MPQTSSSREVESLLANKKQKQWTHKAMNIFIFLIIILIIFVGALVSINNETTNYHKKNVILLISDGFGATAETYGRTMYQRKYNLTQTPLDKILVGQIRTNSLNSLITDSAAGATAFSCSIKTINEAVAVDGNGRACGTVLEAAKARDFLTGLVVTSRVTHATPAAFSSHVLDRWNESEIATQQIGFNPIDRSVDLMFGGGECFFLSKSDKNSCRTDYMDLKKEAKAKQWDFIYTKNDLYKYNYDNIRLPLAALMAKSHLSFEIDRDNKKQPSLKEMTQKALEILNTGTQSNHNGFFLMIEGSRIDMASHK